MRNVDVIPSQNDVLIYHLGPELEAGPLPAFIYFALDGQESLTLDPFNLPVAYLQNQHLRSFSFTLPAHGQGRDPNQALHQWARELATHPRYIDNFIDKCADNIEFLISKGFINSQRLAVGGLSRGAFIASHLAAKVPMISHLLGFAPMTFIRSLNEFQTPHSEANIHALDLINLTDLLWNRRVRFYIGNHDQRVSTEHCFRFVNQLAATAYEHGLRSSPIELLIGPSIGHKGHGTAPHVFKDGAQWIASQLNN